MTNKEWLVTLSPQEWYMAVHWLFNNYGRRYDNTYLAIIAWLEDEHIEEVKPLPPTNDTIQQFLDDFKAKFPEADPMIIPLLVLMIDSETWRFPESFHQGTIAPQAEFIEQHAGLMGLMRRTHNAKRNEDQYLLKRT